MVETVGDLLTRGYDLSVYCGNFRCERNKRHSAVRHGSEVDLEAFDPDIVVDEMIKRLRCTVCGERQASIRVNPGANSINIPGQSAYSPEARQTLLRLMAERRAEKRRAGAYEPVRPSSWKKP